MTTTTTTPPPPFWFPDSVAITSYPRSGNTLLRTIVERLTDTLTGSDARIDRSLVKQLFELGMRGEGEMDINKVWCIKTHYPERTGKAKLKVNRAIVLVRNPFDCIASNFHMLVTSSHTEVVPDEQITGKPYNELWQAWVFEEAMIWKQFHEHWRDVPNTLVIRYEDLVQHMDVEIQRIASFLYGPLVTEGKTTLPSNQSPASIYTRALDLTNTPLAHLGVYAAKNTTTTPPPPQPSTTVATPASSNYLKFSPLHRSSPLPSLHSIVKSLHLYSNEQYRFIIAALRSELCRFGYWDAIVSARPQVAPQIFPWIDFPTNACLSYDHDDDNNHVIIEINSRWGIRPSTPEDPSRRGFDLRWKSQLQTIATELQNNTIT